MIWPLFKYNLKTNRFLWLLLLAVMFMYYSIIISMFDPENIEALTKMLELFPKELMDAMGFSQFGTTLLTFVVGYIYGFLIFLFPLILTVVINHKLVASMVDKGSMAYLLSAPFSRIKVALTQAISGLVLITVFLATTTLCALVVSELLFPGEMEVWMFIKINIYAIILYWAISGIVFFGSAIADDSKVSLGIGVGVPVLFLVIQMLAGAGKDFKWLENFTMYTLFNPEMMIEGDGFVWIGMATLFAIALVFYSAGIWYFNRKNLYI